MHVYLMPLKTENLRCVKDFEIWYFIQGIIRKSWPWRKTPVLKTADLLFLPSPHTPPKHWHRLPQSRKINWIILNNWAEDKWGKSSLYYTNWRSWIWPQFSVHKFLICYRMSVLLNAALNCSVTLNCMDPSNKPQTIPASNIRLIEAAVSLHSIMQACGCPPEILSKKAAFNSSSI